MKTSFKTGSSIALVITASIVTLAVTGSAIALVHALGAGGESGTLTLLSGNPAIIHSQDEMDVVGPTQIVVEAPTLDCNSQAIAAAEPNNPQLVAKSEQASPEIPEWKTVRMRVTAYCPCTICCGALAQGQTANGHIIEAGDCFVAADHRFPFGTEVIVPGYSNDRPVRVFDRGSAIYGNRLDIFFPEHLQARKWGVKYLDVKVRVPIVPADVALVTDEIRD